MNCMKCGREMEGEGAFCQDCLMEMDKYPVEPGTVVLLPRRRETFSLKKVVKRTPSPEEQLSTVRRVNRILILLLLICFVAIALMFEPTMHYIRDEHFEIGQNYSTVTPATTPAPAE